MLISHTELTLNIIQAIRELSLGIFFFFSAGYLVCETHDQMWHKKLMSS